jgi:hypothetical protein
MRRSVAAIAQRLSLLKRRLVWKPSRKRARCRAGDSAASSGRIGSLAFFFLAPSCMLTWRAPGRAVNRQLGGTLISIEGFSVATILVTGTNSLFSGKDHRRLELGGKIIF